MSRDLAIDLGTANTLVYVQDQGSELRARHLRTLGSISDALTDKIVNLGKPVMTVVKSQTPQKPDKTYESEAQFVSNLKIHFGKIKSVSRYLCCTPVSF